MVSSLRFLRRFYTTEQLSSLIFFQTYFWSPFPPPFPHPTQVLVSSLASSKVKQSVGTTSGEEDCTFDQTRQHLHCMRMRQHFKYTHQGTQNTHAHVSTFNKTHTHAGSHVIREVHMAHIKTPSSRNRAGAPREETKGRGVSYIRDRRKEDKGDLSQRERNVENRKDVWLNIHLRVYNVRWIHMSMLWLLHQLCIYFQLIYSIFWHTAQTKHQSFLSQCSVVRIASFQLFWHSL